MFREPILDYVIESLSICDGTECGSHGLGTIPVRTEADTVAKR